MRAAAIFTELYLSLTQYEGDQHIEDLEVDQPSPSGGWTKTSILANVDTRNPEVIKLLSNLHRALQSQIDEAFADADFVPTAKP